jgi:hypothetical protein
MLEAVDERPMCICSNCGMANYPDKMHTIVVECGERYDLRAWRVYQPAVEALAAGHGIDVNEVFLCEPVQDSQPPKCRVFSCTTCKREAKRDVQRCVMPISPPTVTYNPDLYM